MRHVRFVVLAAAAAPLCSQLPPTWFQHAPAAVPQARTAPGMVFDEQRGTTVLFGGHSTNGAVFGQILGDTWEWDGSNWTQRTMSGPQARQLAAMAYDSARQRVVLFGGMPGTWAAPLGDTWEWDGVRWTQAAPAASPSARHGAAAAFDRARSVVVLFGGHDIRSGSFGETWEWNGITWSRRTLPLEPSPRVGHAMAYDTARRRTVMVGRELTSGALETWEYDGVSWTLLPTSPRPADRAGHALVYDDVQQRVVLFGGNASTNPFFRRDTWLWDGTTWVQQQPILAPPERMDAGFAFDTRRGRAVLFGGLVLTVSSPSVSLQDTWEYGAIASAATRTFGTGCGQPPLTIAPTSRPLLGLVQTTAVQNVPTLAFMALGLSATAIGSIPLPLPLDQFGEPGCTLYHDCVVFAEPCPPQGPGLAQHAIAIPSNLALLGMHVYLQAWAPAPGANTAGIVDSNAVELTVGNQ